MGAWGEYDDENDPTWDLMSFIEDELGVGCDMSDYSIIVRRVKPKDKQRIIDEYKKKYDVDGVFVVEGGNRKTIDIDFVLKSYKECASKVCAKLQRMRGTRVARGPQTSQE